ncbi:hypothetical protein PTW37_06510 [Arthrobacter agilis]|nr:DUF3168 domain-containing protein [Arthrobacter agilis]WDF34546.1 hypothetical protein PTW37_06510 [Arthrobacter agilis]
MQHYQAVRNLIPADPTFAVYFGRVPSKPTYPYVVVWGDLGREGGDSLGDAVDQLDLRPRVTYVATGFEQLMFVADRVRAALNRRAPVVAGWTPSKLRQQALAASTTDYDVTFTDGSHPVYAVDEYPFTSDKN